MQQSVIHSPVLEVLTAAQAFESTVHHYGQPRTQRLALLHTTTQTQTNKQHMSIICTVNRISHKPRRLHMSSTELPLASPLWFELNRRLPSCISPVSKRVLVRSLSYGNYSSFIHTQILVHLHVNKTNFHMKGFALGLALKQMRKATWKSPNQYLLSCVEKDCCG